MFVTKGSLESETSLGIPKVHMKSPAQRVGWERLLTIIRSRRQQLSQLPDRVQSICEDHWVGVSEGADTALEQPSPLSGCW